MQLQKVKKKITLYSPWNLDKNFDEGNQIAVLFLKLFEDFDIGMVLADF